MKELTIEQKVKRYDETIAKGKQIQNTPYTAHWDIMKEVAEHLLPELKDSEDERMRKEILAFINRKKSLGSVNPEELEKSNSWIAWLEKQGEQNYTQRDIDGAYLKGIVDAKREVEKIDEQTEKMKKEIAEFIFNSKEDIKQRHEWIKCLGFDVKFSNEEKQDEQKPADKVEPKFKVGDYITDNTSTFQIVRVENEWYYADDGDKICFDVAHQYYHLWTIQDAKDGDVLADGNLPFIFKKIDANNYSYAYCGITSVDDGFKIESEGESGEWTWMQDIKPATKEQRDLLFSKMKEAGYEWDADKKELKKIEQKPADLPNGEDYGIDSLWHAQHILESTLGKVDGYQTDDGILEHKCAISAVKSLYEQKPAWNEEDEKFLDGIIAKLEYLMDRANTDTLKQSFQKRIDWLKSLRPQSTWKPSKEQIMALRWVLNNVPYNKHKEEISGLLDQIKDL